jgi:hypothetical protein
MASVQGKEEERLERREEREGRREESEEREREKRREKRGQTTVEWCIKSSMPIYSKWNPKMITNTDNREQTTDNRQQTTDNREQSSGVSVPMVHVINSVS